MGGLQAVIFDLDGVIVDTARFHYLGWKKLADAEHVPFDEAFNERFKGVSRSDCVKMLFPNEHCPEILESHAARKNRYFLEMVETLTPADLFPGVRSLVGQLRQAGIKTAIASASRNAPRILQKLGVIDLFDAVIDGNGVANSKPAPDCFLVASTALAVPAKGCVVIEDAEAGIRAAHAAGMAVVGLGRPSLLGQAEAVVPFLKDVSLAMLSDVQELRHGTAKE